MRSSKLQKLSSFFLIFFLLFTTIFRVPLEVFMTSQSYAGNKDFYEIVSILVSEDVYSQVQSKVERYARDIQGQLENTRVVILPTPSDASALDIASLNESLFFEGYNGVKSVNFESRLIGTVLIGKIPMPVVFDGAASGRSILPYVDFEKKSFIYNHESERYEKSDTANNVLTPEIWHGIISPNTGSNSDDVQAIKDYFDKNHDFYTGKNIFDSEKGVINADKKTQLDSDYKPYVFYYDQFRENKALRYQEYAGYEMYMQNIEDITYNRYSKELAEKVKNQLLGIQNEDIGELLKKVNPDFDISQFSNSMDISGSSDVLTRYVTDNVSNKFLEIFNGSTLGDMRKHVFNAGRYNDGGNRVNMDMPPFLVSVIDAVSAEVIKNVNTSLENEITNLVANGLSREIVIPLSVEKPEPVPNCLSRFHTFYYGEYAGDITSAAQCSIFRGNTKKGTLVEANRGYNIFLTEQDNALCKNDYQKGDTDARHVVKGYWDGNSPLNLDLPDDGGLNDLNLKKRGKKALRPLFDMTGAKESNNSNNIPSPLDCFTRGIQLKTYQQDVIEEENNNGGRRLVCSGTKLQAPVFGNARAGEWSCRTVNDVLSPVGNDFLSEYQAHKSGGSLACVSSILQFNDDTLSFRGADETCTGNADNEKCSCNNPITTRTYKSIPSYILHVSPTDTEFGTQIRSQYSPALPIDTDRYIDFIGARGGNNNATDDKKKYGYQRIDFPQLFRVSTQSGQELTLASIEGNLKKYLDNISKNINSVIKKSDPKNLNKNQKELYDLLKTGKYPSPDFDLYKILKDKSLEVFSSQNESKEISYLDTLVFAIYWNNLKTVSAKYKFIFENYLGNQFEGNDFSFVLPKSKKQYESAYFVAPGDAKNMYIKLDPDQKAFHPYADIIGQNLALTTSLNAASVADIEDSEGTFECAPPDGVNIFQWIPAVICWLKEMLPPKIKIGTTNCSSEPLSEEQEAEIRSCNRDENANGINDCLEKKLAGGSLALYSDQGRYYYHSAGSLTTEIYDNTDALAFFDNNSYIKHELVRVEIPKNEKQEFSGSNVEKIYDIKNATEEDRKRAQKYIGFRTSSPRATRGKAKTYFYSRGKDVNAYFRSSLVIRDAENIVKIDLKSAPLRVEVRGDRMLVSSFKITNSSGEYSVENSIRVHKDTNICLADSHAGVLSDLAEESFSLSSAPEKILFTIQNISLEGNDLGINFPIDLRLLKDDELVYEESGLTKDSLSSVSAVFAAKKSGRYELKVRDAGGYIGYKTIDVHPDTAKSIRVELGSNILESGGNISSHVFMLEDQYNNLASGDIYTVEGEIEGKGLVFAENNERKISYTLADGYKAFRLKTTDKTGNQKILFTLKDISGKVIDQQQKHIQVVDDIRLQLQGIGDQAKVGGGTYNYRVRFTDGDGNLYSNLRSRVYMNVESGYGKELQSYSLIENGEAELKFQTSKLAGRSVIFEFQLEGGNEIFKKEISILPEEAMRLEMALSSTKIEASKDASTYLEVTLKDRYANDVFTDNTTKIYADVNQRSQDIIEIHASEKQVQQGVARFEIFGTENPGTGYFVVSSQPSLEKNSFSIPGQGPFDKDKLEITGFTGTNGKLTQLGSNFFREHDANTFVSLFPSKNLLVNSPEYKKLSTIRAKQLSAFWEKTNTLKINGIGQNAGSIESFYFWGKDDIQGSAYNSVYSTLLGAEYGDFSQEDYLAGALLFDKDNSSLAVSTLINNPYSFSDSISISQNGALGIYKRPDITQDISLQAHTDIDGRLMFHVYNEALETHIATLYYSLQDTSGMDIELLDSSYTLGDLFVEYAGQKVFEIGNKGELSLKQNTYLEFDEKNGSTLRVFVVHNNKQVAALTLQKDMPIELTRRSGILKNKLKTNEEKIMVLLHSNSYSSRKVFATNGNENTAIYYHDPFAVKNKLNTLHRSQSAGLESSYDEAGIAWQNPNMMMLSFAAGESVGEASMKNQSFSLVNLGDPVVSLKAKKSTFSDGKEKSFDSSIGKIIDDQEGIEDFEVFDYNNDNIKDILSIKNDGYISLFEGTHSSKGYVYQRDLVFSSDAGSSKRVKTGDFTGDGFEDIFFVNNVGSPELYNNVEKDFYRRDISKDFSLSGSVIQAEVFDMDADGKDDIVTLDDFGEIHIFYGGGDAINPTFTKKYIGDGYNIEIAEKSQSFGGAIYFDGLAQINPNSQNYLSDITSEYLSQVQGGVNPANAPSPEFINNSLVQSLLYVELPYLPTEYILPNLDKTSTLDSFKSSKGNISGLQSFLGDYDAYVAYSGYGQKKNVSTFFLRSQYADTAGIKISKKYIDTTPPKLQSGDNIYYEITLKNTSSTTKENIAYVDQLSEYFSFKNDEYILLSEPGSPRKKRKQGLGNYNILLDGIYLNPGEEMKIRYELVTMPLSYGHMQVGLYETAELGDDEYGDIILKEDEKNCGREAKIFRSIAIRSYQEGATIPSCDSNAVDIGNDFPKLEDTNNNGIPDYLDNLLRSESQIPHVSSSLRGNALANAMRNAENSKGAQDLQKYAKGTFNDLHKDSDGDGIPDSDDSMDNSNGATDFMEALDQINGAIDDIAGEIDNVIEGFSCGFGGGSCFANPLNWAPLAPGNDPTLFGMPVGNGLRVNEGVPVFSALTGRQSSCGPSPCCLPSVYPATSATFIPGPFCGGPGAGGSMGTSSPTNVVRMFVTPTLTGGAGIAVCFGGPAIVKGNLPPMGVNPVVPGGNCIVAAMPIGACEGGEGDPSSVGYPIVGDFGVIHANCDGSLGKNLVSPQELSGAFVRDYLEYVQTGVMPKGMYKNYVSSFEDVSEYGAGSFTLPSQPLINIGLGEGIMSSSVDLDLSALSDGNFQDVIEVQNTRIGGFPNFLMDWVERQIDEVTTKLTNLPKIYVILPDFGGIFDGSFKDFGQGLEKNAEKQKENKNKERNNQRSNIDTLRAQKASLDCSGKDALQCSKIQLQITAQSGQGYVQSGNEKLSGIKEAYEFIGSIPLVNIESEQVAISVPWIEPSELGRFQADWELTAEQWKRELQNAQQKWGAGQSCSGTQKEIAACQKENDIRNSASIEAGKLISSLERNIEILEEYKEFPEKLRDFINIKEKYLEQILCNIDALSKLMGEWLNTNGERFKAWVELYMLIKAILKSWQLFIDVFNDYDAECHECKNERQDLNNFVFQLISAVIPSPPIIEFPKWPDIVLDFHNIRAGITVPMPDFELNMRPIVLPTLPELHLPNVPTANLHLPALPVLPAPPELPELPDLPNLPTIELPDLPPPPKIPKLFGPVEAVLNIAKLVTKVMCIMKGSPFVPEWRAGDQIAFLTERNGYLPIDFIDIQPPAFSYSAVSAIKVTSYVNFEFEAEFILEAVRAITAPIDKMTSNIANMFDYQISDIDLSENTPAEIDIEANSGINAENSLMSLNENPEGVYMISGLLTGKFISFLRDLSGDEGVMMDNSEFTHYMNKQLSSIKFAQDNKIVELRNLWKEVENISLSKDQELIDDLKIFNTQKFDTLKDIIQTEINYTKEQQKSLYKDSIEKSTILVGENEDSRVTAYNKLMEKYNVSTMNAAIQLLEGESKDSQDFQLELDSQAKEMMSEVRGGLTSYKKSLLAAKNTPLSSGAKNSCIGNSTYEYKYEGMYILEDGKNYKLFDYTNILDGSEVPYVDDMDGDNDDDVLYLASGKLFFKENRKNTPEKQYVSSRPLTVKASHNPFFNGSTYYESVNNLSQQAVSDGAMNISFDRPTRKDINNFRLSYHTIVDRYMDDSDVYTPLSVETHIVDGLSNIDSQNAALYTGEDYIIREQGATLAHVGRSNGVKLTTEKMVNIRKELESGREITLTKNTKIFSGNNSFSLRYVDKGGEKKVSLTPYTSIAFNKSVSISGIIGDAYVGLGILEDISGDEIFDYVGMPLSLGAKIVYSGPQKILSEKDHVDIRYYDGSEFGMDLRDVRSYTLYDLGDGRSDALNMRLQVKNDFYYARIQSFKKNKLSTQSKQILLSPQKYADTFAPQLGLTQKIRIPVYQKEEINLTPYIYEDGGLGGISEVRVDFDLSHDNDGDGDSRNDADTKNINIKKSTVKISIEFGEFTKVFEKDINILLIDDNGNIGSRIVKLEVYPPLPSIENIEKDIISGAIDETLLDEPVRLYRYRGGSIAKLESKSGSDYIHTDAAGNYSFELPEKATGLELTYSGSLMATIDEFTGKIDLKGLNMKTRVLASNDTDNLGVYPEVQIWRSNTPIFKQNIMMQEKNPELVTDFSENLGTGIYIRIMNQEGYSAYTIPNGVQYNPGSISLYRNIDSDKTPIMTLFRDGRVNITGKYELIYRSEGNFTSLVLVNKDTGGEIAHILYKLEASYIIR